MAAPTTDRWRWPLTLALVTLLYLLLRATGLDRVVTTDEPFWLGRSANFYRAIWQDDLEFTFQHAHPGVTTMWAGMVGYWLAAPDYVDVFTTNLRGVYGIPERLREIDVDPLDVLNAARIAKIALQALLFALCLHWLRRLFGVTVATVAGLLIALDPFLIAHDRVLHVDGLLAIAALAAVLAIADADLRDRRRAAAWLVAGALAAVAWLTRSTGLALVGVAGLVLLTDAIAGDEPTPRARLGAAAWHGLLWAGAAGLTTILLWPAIWAAPERALGFMAEWLGEAAAEGHELPTYFLGEIRIGDPGPLFYPVSIAWRLSVAGTLGLLLAIVALAMPGIRSTIPERARRAGAILLLFAGSYTAGMTLGAKKFDRYALPVHPVLDIVAAIGIVAVAGWLLSRRREIARLAVPVALTALLVGQAWVTLAARPYEFAAFNPLLGGAERAEETVQVGWGEGFDQVAAWLIEETGVQPGETTADPSLVRVSGGNAPLAYLLPHPFEVPRNGFPNVATWEATDYYVGYIQQWQRNLSGDVIGYLEAFEPAHTVDIAGVHYAAVWDLAGIPPPPWLGGAEACAWTFAPWLRLANVTIEGEATTLWFETVRTRDLPEAVAVSVELVPRAVDTSPVEEAWSDTFDPLRQRNTFTGVTLAIPPLAEHGTGAYLTKVTMTDAETGEVIMTTPPGSRLSQSEAILGSACGAP